MEHLRSAGAIDVRLTPGVVELRAAGDASRITGYAAKFGKLSRNLGGFVEQIDPAAFNRSRGRDWPEVVARFNHDDNMTLGTTGAGTLSLEIDDVGLRYEVTPPQARADVVELVARGDVRQSSFAFREAGTQDQWGMTEQKYPLRTLLSVELTDVAPVSARAAYPDATAGLRSLAAQFEVDLEEVRTLAAADNLRKFFVKTGPKGEPAKTFGAAAKLELLAKRDPDE